MAMATDAFTLDWAKLRGFANPPWNLIGRVLAQTYLQQAKLVLVAPVWKAQGWYPVLLEMLVGIPLLIPPGRDLITAIHEDSLPEVVPQLAVWIISGSTTRTARFQRELRNCSWRHGDRSHPRRMTHSLASGSARWCCERDSDPISCPLGEVVNFLADLYEQGYQYRSINSYRSAILSVHEKIYGYEVGQHPMVSRLLKGIFHERPPQPGYCETWDVSKVTAYIESKGENDTLPLSELTQKTVMLLALTRPSRSADLSQLDLRFRRYLPEGVSFQQTKLAKQSRQSKPVAEFFFLAFMANPLLCPVVTLRAYEGRTKEFRREEGSNPLFLTTIRLHNVASSSTIARWLKSILEKAGVDTSIFKAHSVRGAAVTAASNAGVTTCDILNAADWSSQSVFQRFYYKPSKQTGLGRAVLDPQNQVDTTNPH